jgi:hypothetical protein
VATVPQGHALLRRLNAQPVFRAWHEWHARHVNLVPALLMSESFLLRKDFREEIMNQP